MKKSILLLAFLGLICCAYASDENLKSKLNAQLLMAKKMSQFSPQGGNGCMVCTLLATIVEGIVRGESGPIDHFISNKLCPLLPGTLQYACEFVITEYGPVIIQMLEAKANPDDICRTFRLCLDPACRLFPSSHFLMTPELQHLSSKINGEALYQKIVSLVTSGSQEAAVTKNGATNSVKLGSVGVPLPPPRKVLPVFDGDLDAFSTVPTFRGSNWRGKDCLDTDASVYPGRKAINRDPGRDHDCNGISGYDPVDGGSYEHKFCGNSTRLGVAVLGGSACSHFAIQDKWVTFNNITKDTYKDLLPAVENELDWPHRSWGTGYDSGYAPLGVPVDSVYLAIRNRNLCNHRDFQQLGINGQGSKDVLETISSLARNQQLDHPMLVFHSPLGDDVCNTHTEDTVAFMTTPEEFRTYVYNSLKYLDSVLPPKSHVMFVGLVNGSILWNTLHDRMHPFGVTYPQLYSWMLCVKSNPCVGWLNPNATLRALSSERAKLLSDQYPVIIREHSHQFKNFDMGYFPFPLKPIFDKWASEGHDVVELIEAVDGFHPSTVGNTLAAQWLVSHIEKEYPTWLPPVNPYNPKIKAVFGDQGGY